MCYWEGGGKKGQFPPGFGKRGSLKGSTSNTRQESLKLAPTVNATITNHEVDQVFACITMGDTKFKVPVITNLDYQDANSKSELSLYSLSALDKENSLESLLYWSTYLYIIYLVCVVQLTLVTGIKPTVPLSAIDKENSLESLLYWSTYLYIIYLVCALSCRPVTFWLNK